MPFLFPYIYKELKSVKWRRVGKLNYVRNDSHSYTSAKSCEDFGGNPKQDIKGYLVFPWAHHGKRWGGEIGVPAYNQQCISFFIL